MGRAPSCVMRPAALLAPGSWQLLSSSYLPIHTGYYWILDSDTPTRSLTSAVRTARTVHGYGYGLYLYIYRPYYCYCYCYCYCLHFTLDLGLPASCMLRLLKQHRASLPCCPSICQPLHCLSDFTLDSDLSQPATSHLYLYPLYR